MRIRKKVQRVKSLQDVDFSRLLNDGKRIFLFDFDNTINTWKSTHIPERAVKIFEYLKSNGAEVYIISNGSKRALDYDIPAVWRALKPFSFKVRFKLKDKLKRKEEIVVIGDQVFTDVLFAKLLGVDAIKVEPIDKTKEAFGTKILRFFEKILHKLTRRSRRE
ncbi:YqeG family HAD IIIA-type phosphatase [Fervidobacterium sp.]